MFRYLEAMAITLIWCLVFVLKTEPGFASDDECPLDYPKIHAMERHGNHCYEFVNQTGSWYDARDDCLSRNGTLTDIHSTSENYALIVFLTKLGLKEGSFRLYVWIGMSKNNDGRCQWESRANFGYTNWYPGYYHIEEVPSTSSSHCGIMDYDHGLWFTTDCNSQFVYGWICKYNIN